MALIKCSECGKDISTTAENCPHCGCKTAHGQSVANVKGYIVGWVLAFIFLFVGVIVMVTNMGNNDEAVGFGFLMVIAGIIDMCVVAYKAKEAAESGSNTYSSYGQHSGSSDLEWECPRCYFVNQPNVTSCIHCGEDRGRTRGVVAEKIPTWKRIQMEEEKQRLNPVENKNNKCIFCGAEMAEGQLFCGACGQRKD